MQSPPDLVHWENKSHDVAEVLVLLSSKSAPADTGGRCACAELQVGRSPSASALMSFYQDCYHHGNAHTKHVAIHSGQQKSFVFKVILSQLNMLAKTADPRLFTPMFLI